MSELMKGKTALVLGLANRWSLAYSIAQAFAREGARLTLTYQGDRQKGTVEQLAAELGSDVAVFACDVTVPEQLDALTAELKNRFGRLDCVVHSRRYR